MVAFLDAQGALTLWPDGSLPQRGTWKRPELSQTQDGDQRALAAVLNDRGNLALPNNNTARRWMTMSGHLR